MRVERISRQALILVSLALLGSLAAPTRAATLYYFPGPDVSPQGLELSYFSITSAASPPREDMTVTIRFSLTNATANPITLGRYGMFVAVRDGNDVNRDFGYKKQNYTIAPHQRLDFTIPAQLSRARFGPPPWTFWPAFYVGGWGPYEWHKARIEPNKLTFSPPFLACDTWTRKKTVWGVPWAVTAKARCNSSSGAVGVLTDAWIGAGRAQAWQKILFESDRRATVRAHAMIVYTGGAPWFGPVSETAAEAFWETYDENGRIVIEPLYSFADGCSRTLALVAIVAPGMSATTAGEAVEAIGLVGDAVHLSEGLATLVDSGDATSLELDFELEAVPGDNYLDVGLKGLSGALLLGQASAVLVGQVQQVTLTFE